MPQWQDHYQVLDIGPNARIEDIRAARNDKVHNLHPDHHTSSPFLRFFEEETKKVNEAYNVLCEPNKRQRFDAERHQRNNPPKPQSTSVPRRPTTPPSHYSASSRNTVPRARKPKRGVSCESEAGDTLTGAFAATFLGTFIFGLIVVALGGPFITDDQLMGMSAIGGAVFLVGLMVVRS